MGPRSREWVSFGAVAAALVAVTISAIVAGRSNDKVETTRPTPSPSPSPTQASFEYFDGTIHGWRIAPSDVLEKEGFDRNLNLDCTAREAGASTRTDLDFEIIYLPKNIGKPSHPPYVGKWICGEMGLSMSWNMDWDDNPNEGIGSLRIDRFLVGTPSVGLYAPKDLVEACTVRERPAICVHFEDDVKGRGHGGKIVVLEDAIFDPHATVLLITGVIGIPYDEVLKIAEGIR